jgi:hypothetical protein
MLASLQSQDPAVDRATSTVNYPLLTVSDGSWTSTIIKAPLTISQWVLEVVTLTTGQATNQKRQDFAPFWPIPATTPHWPAVVYAGPDGSSTTKAPTAPFPTPPPSIGPDAAPPPTGSWPKRQIQPYVGQIEEPLVKMCDYFDLLCIQQPWLYGDNGTFLDPEDGDDFDEN